MGSLVASETYLRAYRVRWWYGGRRVAVDNVTPANAKEFRDIGNDGATIGPP